MTVSIEELQRLAGGRLIDLAAAAECSHSVVAGWKRGNPIAIPRAKAISRNLGVPLWKIRPDVWDEPEPVDEAMFCTSKS